MANPGIVYSREAAGLRRRIAASGARSGGRDNSAGRGLLATLTRREQQVASLVSQGLTNRRMAQRLHVTENTTEMHLSNIFAKLGVSTRAEAGRGATVYVNEVVAVPVHSTLRAESR